MLKWPSPWGDGFPGWHIECSAMAASTWAPDRFPHRRRRQHLPAPRRRDRPERGRFRAAARTTWMHGQHLLVDGLKMAKSTGNVYTVSRPGAARLRATGVPLSVRDGPLPITPELHAGRRYARRRRGLYRLRQRSTTEGGRRRRRRRQRGEAARGVLEQRRQRPEPAEGAGGGMEASRARHFPESLGASC